MDEKTEQELLKLLLKINDKIENIDNRLSKLEDNKTNKTYPLSNDNKPQFHSLSKINTKNELEKQDKLNDSLSETANLVILHNKLHPLKK